MRPTFLVFITVLLSAVGSPAAEMEHWCKRQATPVSQPSRLPVQLSGLVFEALNGRSIGQITVVNKSQETVKFLLIVAELLDDRGAHFLTIPFYNIDAHAETPTDFEYKAWLYAHASHGVDAVMPGANAKLESWSPFFKFGCPASAHIRVVELQYRNGGAFHYKAAELNLDPVVSRAPIPDPVSWYRWMPLELTGKIKIDSDGRPQVSDLSVSSSELHEWLQSQVSAWKFSPEVTAGQKTSSEITFILVIGNDPLDFAHLLGLKAAGVVGPIVYLRAEAPASGLGWTVLVDDLPVSFGRKR